MPVSCPSCGAEDTQRLVVVFESGISDIDTQTAGSGIGLGIRGIGIGIGASHTKGVAQTALSQRSAPPAKASYIQIVKYWFFTTLVVEIALDLIHVPEKLVEIIAFAILAAFCYWLLQAILFNRNTWPSLYQRWRKSYHCMRCGNIFEGG